VNVFRIHVKGEDRYLNREGREVSAVDAPLFAKDEVREAEGIAHKKFGHPCTPIAFITASGG
jgi:hypothetical protein